MNNIFLDSSTPHRQQEKTEFPIPESYSVPLLCNPFITIAFILYGAIHSSWHPPHRFLPATSLCIGYPPPTPDHLRLSPHHLCCCCPSNSMAAGSARPSAGVYSQNGNTPRSQSPPAPSHHRRGYQACDPCRKRKVKCDLGSTLPFQQTTTHKHNKI